MAIQYRDSKSVMHRIANPVSARYAVNRPLYGRLAPLSAALAALGGNEMGRRLT